MSAFRLVVSTFLILALFYLGLVLAGPLSLLSVRMVPEPHPPPDLIWDGFGDGMMAHLRWALIVVAIGLLPFVARCTRFRKVRIQRWWEGLGFGVGVTLAIVTVTVAVAWIRIRVFPPRKIHEDYLSWIEFQLYGCGIHLAFVFTATVACLAIWFCGTKVAPSASEV